MEPRTTTLRLRRVRFKDGRAPLEIIRQRSVQEERAEVEARIREALDTHVAAGCRVGGFAFVVWGHDTASTADLRCYEPCVPNLIAPDFVKERLRHEISERWMRRGLKDEGVI